MGKILLTTDFHLDSWTHFSSINEEGYNTRLLKQLALLEGLLGYCKEHDCKFVHGGDLWNRRLLIPSDVIHLTYELLASFPEVTMYFLIGNHDTYNWNSRCTPLRVLNGLKHVSVIDYPCEVYFQPNTVISFAPYGAPIPAKSANRTENVYSILLAHYGVNEAKLGPANIRMESDLTVKQLKEFNYDLTLLGHIHKPQALANDVIVLGSPMAHSFHEVDEEKYFYVFDCETKELVKYPTNAPKFIVHNIESKKSLKTLSTVLQSDNYYRINVLTPEITHEDMKPFVAHNVVISFASQSQYDYSVADNREAEGRTPKEEVEDYYEALDTELDKKKLKEKSLKIIGDD